MNLRGYRVVAATTEMEDGLLLEESHGLEKGAVTSDTEVTKVTVSEYHTKLLNAFMLPQVRRKGLWAKSLVLPTEKNTQKNKTI